MFKKYFDIVKKYFFEFLAVFTAGGAIYKLYGFFDTIFNKFNQNNLVSAFWGFIALFILVIIAFLIQWKLYRVERKQHDASKLDVAKLEKEKGVLIFQNSQDVLKLEGDLSKLNSVFSDFNNAFGHIHLSQRASNESYILVRTRLYNFCTDFAHALSKMTGEECSVCIKQTAWIQTKTPRKAEHNKYGITTLSRDIKSDRVRGRGDGNSKFHILEENSDFLYIYQNIDNHNGGVFFSNDLLSEPQYKNSSFKIKHNTANPNWGNITREEKEKIWGLPYKSCIVAPIGLRGIEGDAQMQKDALVGYLCVDMNNVNLFKKDIHAEILAGSAEALYNIVKDYKVKYKEAKKIKS